MRETRPTAVAETVSATVVMIGGVVLAAVAAATVVNLPRPLRVGTSGSWWPVPIAESSLQCVGRGSRGSGQDRSILERQENGYEQAQVC